MSNWRGRLKFGLVIGRFKLYPVEVANVVMLSERVRGGVAEAVERGSRDTKAHTLWFGHIAMLANIAICSQSYSTYNM